jgi:hypothetical protein
VVVGLTAARCALPLASATRRVSECAALDGLLDRVGDGRSDVLVLPGEPGIGKTTQGHWPRTVFDPDESRKTESFHEFLWLGS